MASAKQMLGPKGVAAVREFFISCKPEPSETAAAAAAAGPAAGGSPTRRPAALGGAMVGGPANDAVDVSTMQVQASTLSAGLRLLGQQISALDPEEQKKKAASIAKVRVVGGVGGEFCRACVVAPSKTPHPP